MKNFIVILLAGLVSASCISLSLSDTDKWLDAKNGAPAEVDLSGRWDAGYYMGGGWGVGHFFQDGNRFRGTMSAFNVKGRVLGRKVYMVIWGGSVTYTAELTVRPDGTLIGEAVENAVVGTERAETAAFYPMEMKRME